MTLAKLLLPLLAAATLPAADLHPRTLREFQIYMDKADLDMSSRAASPSKFLWATESPDRRQALEAGRLVIEPYTGHAPLDAPDAFIYDWIGAAFIPNAKLSDFHPIIQDYNAYPSIYAPEVASANLVSRDGNRFQGHMRLFKKKIISVNLDATFDVTGKPLSPNRFQYWSRSLAIREVHDAGKPSESLQPPDTGFGFLWRLHSYWQLEQTPAGLFIELRSISLTRDIPTGLGWAIKPMVTTMPRESLEHTLAQTRAAVQARLK